MRSIQVPLSRRRRFGVAGLLVASLLAALTSASATRAASPSPVVVELFTSEGCSDCPAADALLAKIAPGADGVSIVALSEHVDYWDRLGWRDRFSSAAFTNRQRVYGAHFNVDSIYTPQMVVDGMAECVGSDAAAARRAITKAAATAHGVVRIHAESSGGNQLSVDVAASELPKISSGDRLDFVIAITEDGLSTDVKRGENHGRTLSHVAVVRQMATVAESSADLSKAHGLLTIDPDWRRDRLKVVAFVQERRGRRILASAALPLPMTSR